MRIGFDGLLLAVVVAAAPLQAQQDFQRWVANDRAVMQSVDRPFSLGPFNGTLPLGWVAVPVSDASTPDGTLSLMYLGPQVSVQATPIATAVLSLEQNPGRESEFAVWPSSFSGWKTVPLNGIWGQQAWLPGSSVGRQTLVLRIPATDAVLTLEVDCASDAGDGPDFMGPLAATLRYSGTGRAVTPPTDGAADGRFRAGSRSPRLDVFPDALADSPFHSYVGLLRQALHQGSDPAENNHAVLLDTGRDALLARLHLIRSATRSIRIQTFIWSNDDVGRLMIYELISAAKRGVKVQIIADHIASFRDVELAAFVATVSTNLSFRHYRPAANRIDPAPLQEALNFLIPNDTNQRMHNKLFVVDDAVAITGGRNIENTYYAQSAGINFKDRDVLFSGPALAYAVASFDAFWTFDKTERTERLTDVRRVIRGGKFRRRETRDDFEIDGRLDGVSSEADSGEIIRQRLVARMMPVDKALFLADPPGKETRAYTAWRRGSIARQLESMMKAAQHSLVLQTPYLLLDGGMYEILKTLREENPSIQLLASSNSFGATDNPIVYAAGFKMRRSYFRAGVDIYEYRNQPAALRDELPDYDALLRTGAGMRSSSGTASTVPFLCIHAKAMVIDELVAYVGSYNFDPRSISLNTEVGLLVHDPAFAAAVMQSVMTDIQPQNSWVIARRATPRSADEVSRLMPADAEVTRGAIDMWPFRNTAGYALKEGLQAQRPGTPSFYRCYEDIGSLPGADDEGMALKKVMTCLSTVLSGLVVPLL